MITLAILSIPFLPINHRNVPNPMFQFETVGKPRKSPVDFDREKARKKNRKG